MKKIASFTVNHDVLQKGMYVSRIDGDVITYDIRMKIPNGGEYLSMRSAHTIEHLFATFARNSEHGDKIVYVGPMGCKTGFYLLVRDTLSHEEAIALVQESMAFIATFAGDIPGTTKIECGNYLYHDLAGAKAVAEDMQCVLKDWSVEKLQYKE